MNNHPEIAIRISLKWYTRGQRLLRPVHLCFKKLLPIKKLLPTSLIPKKAKNECLIQQTRDYKLEIQREKYCHFFITHRVMDTAMFFQKAEDLQNLLSRRNTTNWCLSHFCLSNLTWRYPICRNLIYIQNPNCKGV